MHFPGVQDPFPELHLIYIFIKAITLFVYLILIPFVDDAGGLRVLMNLWFLSLTDVDCDDFYMYIFYLDSLVK